MGTEELGVKFLIRFEGEKFEDHLMEVRELTSFLQGLDNAVRQISFVKGEKNKLQTDARLKEGCIDISFVEIAKSIIETLVIISDICSAYTMGKNLKNYLTTTSVLKGLFSPEEVGRLNLPVFIRNIKQIVAPLKGEDNCGMKIIDSTGKVLAEITSEEYRRITTLCKTTSKEESDLLSVTVKTQHVDEDKAWVFLDQTGKSFRAKICDRKSLDSIRDGVIRIGFRDILKIDRKRRVKGKKRTYSVVKSIDIRKMPRE